MRFLVEVEGWDAHDQLCSRMMNHLEHAGEKFRIMNGEYFIGAGDQLCLSCSILLLHLNVTHEVKGQICMPCFFS